MCEPYILLLFKVEDTYEQPDREPAPVVPTRRKAPSPEPVEVTNLYSLLMLSPLNQSFYFEISVVGVKRSQSVNSKYSADN